jgi:hypothetical protein
MRQIKPISMLIGLLVLTAFSNETLMLSKKQNEMWRKERCKLIENEFYKDSTANIFGIPTYFKDKNRVTIANNGIIAEYQECKIVIYCDSVKTEEIKLNLVKHGFTINSNLLKAKHPVKTDLLNGNKSKEYKSTNLIKYDKSKIEVFVSDSSFEVIYRNTIIKKAYNIMVETTWSK